MLPDDIFLKIVRSAVKAPSGHNSQPWLFAKEDDGICIKPDFSRTLPVADPGHRELFISLGCVAETAMIAAAFYGYRPALQINTLNPDGSIKILLQKDATIEQPALFSYLTARQTTRNLYDKKVIPAEDLMSLKQATSESGVGVRFFSGASELRRFSPYIAEANAIQMSNPSFKSELIGWIRFSEKEAKQKGDGLFSACIGFPSVRRMLGCFVLKNIVTAKSGEKRLLKQLEATSVLALFTSQSINKEYWIKTGMVFQRFGLTATMLNLNYSHLNSPCQVSEIGKKMINELGLHSEFPQLIIRLGYSKKMPFAFRRNVYHSINH